MGRLRLPDAGEKPEPTKKLEVVKEEHLTSGDLIDYRLTVEVDMGGGRKAWVKFGTESTVREGETTEHARRRVTDYVNAEIDRRIEELS
jgi:hypothetical protein